MGLCISLTDVSTMARMGESPWELAGVPGSSTADQMSELPWRAEVCKAPREWDSLCPKPLGTGLAQWCILMLSRSFHSVLFCHVVFKRLGKCLVETLLIKQCRVEPGGDTSG